jgi:hypothetical protein
MTAVVWTPWWDAFLRGDVVPRRARVIAKYQLDDYNDQNDSTFDAMQPVSPKGILLSGGSASQESFVSRVLSGVICPRD